MPSSFTPFVAGFPQEAGAEVCSAPLSSVQAGHLELSYFLRLQGLCWLAGLRGGTRWAG